MRQSFRATRGGRGKNAGKGFAVLTRGDLLEDPVGAEVEEAVGVEAGAMHGHRVLQNANDSSQTLTISSFTRHNE